jgi:hypothetical protein
MGLDFGFTSFDRSIHVVARRRMGIQVAILGTVDDIGELLALAGSLGARAVSASVPADDPPTLEAPEALFRARPGDKLYLLPSGLDAVEIFPIRGSADPPDGPHAWVNVRTSPVVEVIPTDVDGQTLRAGRLYLGVARSHPLYGYPKRLYERLRRATASWGAARPGPVYVGPRAAELAARGYVLKSLIGEELSLR